jgi:hypothetical protein
MMEGKMIQVLPVLEIAFHVKMNWEQAFRVLIQCLMKIGQYCNTPGVAMAGTHLGTQDYDHMWKNLRSKSIRGFGN